jgi:hypothetical protein
MANEMRLNNDYRKGLTKDFRLHAQQEDTPQKDEYQQSISDYDIAVANAFWSVTKVIERAFPPEDVVQLRQLQDKYSTVDSVAKDSCFYLKVVDEHGSTNWLETDERSSYSYNSNNDDDEDTRFPERHFSFELFGNYTGNNDYSYGQQGNKFAYAYFRDDLLGQGFNPDIEIEHKDNSNNPHLSVARENLDMYLKQNHINNAWGDKYALWIIGTGGCRSRAIKCTRSEFDSAQTMLHSKQAVVQCHEKWIEGVLRQTEVVKTAIQSYKHLSSVKELADTLGWSVNEHMLLQKGTDLVISNPDSIKSMLDNIKGVQQTREDKILAVMKYNKEKALAS